MNTESKKVLVGEGVKFERIRRITGYLVGTVDRFNNAKRAEERDRRVDLGGPFKFVLTHDAARQTRRSRRSREALQDRLLR